MLNRLLAALAVTLIACSPVLAQSGDPERGRVIAFTCSGCHGIPFYKNVYPSYTVPRLAGQSEGYIISALKAYRSGARKHATMQAQANTLTDQDISDIAAYFVSLAEESE
jgi:cytochrome c553